MLSYYKHSTLNDLYISVSVGTWYYTTNILHENICRLLSALAHHLILQTFNIKTFCKIYLYITVGIGTWYDITNFQHETICRLLSVLAHGIILQGLIHGMIFQTLTMQI